MMKQTVLACAAILGLSDVAARAVIITGDGTAATPGRNTTAPIGTLANSGWQYQADFGAFLGTPVSDRWFVTAAHFGLASSTIVTPDNVSHTLTGNFMSVAGTDIVLREVSTATPFVSGSIAPLYDPAVDGALQTVANSATPDSFVVFGRGTARGTAVTGKGWEWGVQDGLRSWGTNVTEDFYKVSASDVVNGSPFAAGTRFLAADFDGGSGNEGTLSGGDSGGGVFVFKNGAWRLAAINYGVNVYYNNINGTGNPIAAYNAAGLYEQISTNPNTFAMVAGPGPVPQTWDASYLPDSLTTIRATVPEPASLGVLAVGAAGLLRRRRVA